ncbi:oxidation resistance protein 1 [Lobosporangium transversale]|nr:oxidation resistance protein 1 [Lobosporangium transversale]
MVFLQQQPDKLNLLLCSCCGYGCGECRSTKINTSPKSHIPFLATPTQFLDDSFVDAAPLTISRTHLSTNLSSAEEYLASITFVNTISDNKRPKSKRVSGADTNVVIAESAMAMEDRLRRPPNSAKNRFDNGSTSDCAQKQLSMTPADEAADDAKHSESTAKNSFTSSPSPPSSSSSLSSLTSTSSSTSSTFSSSSLPALSSSASSDSSSSSSSAVSSPQSSVPGAHSLHCHSSPQKPQDQNQDQHLNQNYPAPSHNHHSRYASCPRLCIVLPDKHYSSPQPASANNLHSQRQRSLTSSKPSSPIVLYRSKSIVDLSTAPSSALNISPAECISLSPSTASPADAAYFATRAPRASSYRPAALKKRSSLFFASLSPSSASLSPPASTTIVRSRPSTPPAQEPSRTYQAPDYLTAFFAETTAPPVPIHPPSSAVSPSKAAVRRAFAFAKQDRFRPLTIARATITASVSAPTSPLARDPSFPQSESTVVSASTSLESSFDSTSTRADNNIGSNHNSNNSGSLRSTISHPHYQHHSRHISLDPKSQASCATGTRYRSRHNTSSSIYQPIMIPRKAKQAVLSLVTTEQPKYGPPRSTQSTVNGGDWGESMSSAVSDDHHHTHDIEPNSASSGQDPWMLVNASGVSNASNVSHINNTDSLPANVTAPILARDDQMSALPPLLLLDRYDDTDPVLEPEIAQQIRMQLPRKLRNATKWNLVYSSDQHGISMTTLFHRCRGKGPMVMAIKDSTGCVFGAFITEELKPNLSYYGTGECFLWSVTTLANLQAPSSPSPLASPSPLQLSTPQIARSPSPTPSSNAEGRHRDLYAAMNDRLTAGERRSPSPLLISTHQHLENSPSNSPSLRPINSAPASSIPSSGPSSGRRKRKQKVVQFWKWTGKNDYMVLSEPGFIGLGGGDGKFGLWLHSDLEMGHSAKCATFDNEPLAAACRHPIIIGPNGEQQRAPTLIKPSVAADRPYSRSSSPKNDKEEFYCQTVEIWAMAL